MLATVIQPPDELVMARQLSDALETPICVVDADGSALHYNEAAEALLGYRGPNVENLTHLELGVRLSFTDSDGAPIPVEQLPAMVALHERRPAHRWLDIIGLHGERQRVEATAFPIRRGDGEVLGAVALFWPAELF